MHWVQVLSIWLLLASAALVKTAAAQSEVDLELVLAVDVSRSMDFEELKVQRDGYVAAFRHPDVIAAIRSGPLGRIAVSYVEWAGPQSQTIVVPWTVIDGEQAAQNFAAQLSTTARGRYMWTSISAGLTFAAGALAKNQFTSARQIIDISGDGPNNRGSPIEPVRASITATGITINGLPIVLKPFGPYSIPNLDVYYEDCVIGGPGSFIIPVSDMSQLGLAIRRKLLLEIAGPAPELIRVSDTPALPRVDCLIGEKLLNQRLRR